MSASGPHPKNIQYSCQQACLEEGNAAFSSIAGGHHSGCTACDVDGIRRKRPSAAARSTSPSWPKPSSYDCHASQTFALLHPVTPQYSLLVRWDATENSKIVGDLAKSWTYRSGRPDLHLHAPRRHQVPRRLAADLGRHQGHLRAHRQSARGRHLGAQGALCRCRRHRDARSRRPSSSS